MSKEVGKAIGIGLLTFGLGTLFGAATAFGNAFRTIGVNMMLSGAALAFAKQPSRRSFSTIKGSQFGGWGTLPLCFGQVRTGGQVVFLGTSGTNNEYAHLAFAVSACHAGGCGDLIAVYLNGRKIDAGDIDGSGDVTSGDFQDLVNIRWHPGTDAQTVDTTLDTASALWASTAEGERVAYLAIRFFYDKANDKDFQKAFPGGQIPTVEVAFEGLKVYDPRLDDTNGGSGAQRYTDATTWEFSSNTALCDATYKIMSRGVTGDGGWGLDPATQIDWDSAADAADVCDGNITVPDGLGGSTSIARYACSVSLDTNRTKRENSEVLLATMLGKCVPVGRQVKLYAGAYDTPATTIDETWLAGGITQEPKLNIREVWNSCHVNYTRADKDFKEDTCRTITNSSFETEDGGQNLPKELTIATDNEYRAQYIANVMVELSRYQRKIIIECNAKALDIEPWECVTLDIDVGARTYTGTFRVANWEWQGGTCSVELLEVASAPYGTVLGDYIEWAPEDTPSTTNETPPEVTGLAAVGVLDAITLGWDPLAVSQYMVIEVHRSTSSGGVFTSIDEIPAVNGGYVDSQTSAVTRYYKLRTRDAWGNNSDFTSEVNATSKTAADGATVGADWTTNVASRPTELTDGRVSTALTGSGHLQSAVTASATVNGIAASTVTSRANDGWNLTQAGGGTRLADARAANQLYASNVGARQSVQPLTAEDVGGTCTVTVDSYTLTVGSLSVSVTGGTVTGLGFLTTYDIAFDDATLAGGAVTHAAYTGSNIAAANARVFEGQVTTPDDVGGPEVPGSGGGGYPP